MDRSAVQGGNRIGQFGLGASVVDRHPGTGIGEEPGQGDPATGESQDGHGSVAQGATANRLQGQRGGIDRRGHRHAHSWLIDDRNSVTPRSPDRIATIQNRSVIFSSSQPPSSKWWWMGDMRKIRRPWVSLK